MPLWAKIASWALGGLIVLTILGGIFGPDDSKKASSKDQTATESTARKPPAKPARKRAAKPHAKPKPKPAKHQAVAAKPKSARAPASDYFTAAGFSKCIRAGGVTLNRSGATPDDPQRTKRPRGYDSARADVTYLGAANFAQGGFVDLWVTDEAATARDLADSFTDPALEPEEAKNYSFESTRNLLLAFSAEPFLKSGDKSGKAFDRCLARAQ